VKKIVSLATVAALAGSIAAVGSRREPAMDPSATGNYMPLAALGLPSLAVVSPGLMTTCDIATAQFADRALESDQFGEINFKHGLYVQRDDLGNADWMFSLVTSSPIFSFGPDAIRIVNVNAEHLSGSGSWHIALGYTCYANRLRKVLELSSLLPITVTKSGDALESTIWTTYSGGAFMPGGKKHVVAHWNSKAIQFTVDERNEGH
jgi:hypothetical protein